MKHSQDISSQVMIEVGLALSMAFFSLFVLALISLNASKFSSLVMSEETQNVSIHVATQAINTQNKTTKKLNGSSRTSDSITNKTYYIFYNGQHFYDKLLKQITIEQVPLDVSLVVAAPDNLPLIELIALQKRINHPKASITNLTEDWLNAMERLP